MNTPKNIAASVHERLLNRARREGRPFNELLQYYAMERFLYRLSVSRHAERFILKGALLLRVWQSPEIRPTMDIDLLGRTSRELEDVKSQIRDIISTDVKPDGLVFDADSVEAERITEDAEYQGLRIRFRGLLGSAKVTMQIDIGFGDIVFPGAEKESLPTMLNDTPPELLCYSKESVVAEKFQAMVKLGMLNSRMKDFYDIDLLSRRYNFDGAKLAEAIRLTFNERSTEIPAHIEAFSETFINSKQVQWNAFRKRLKREEVAVEFRIVVHNIQKFLAPAVSALSTGEKLPMHWKVGGPWR
ncbi:MAG: nucleotidyl transferase AbiEii/AbiGii toxin family protein [Acidobacteriota bacterium]